MNRLLLIVLVSLGVIGLVSAVLVPYLSNSSEVNIEVESPIMVTSKLNTELISGGETINYKATAKNKIDKVINGILTLTISNDKGSASCDDFESISLNVGIEELVPTTFSCSNGEFGIVKITKEVKFNSYEEENYLGTFVLKVNVDPTTYKIETQVMNLI